MVEGFVLSLAAWLATVALHGVLIVALVAFATRRMRSGPARERAWKLALFGALVTATAQLGLGVDPIGGAVALRGPAARTASSAPHAIPAREPRRALPITAIPVAALPTPTSAPAGAPRDVPPAVAWDAPLPFATTAPAPLFDPAAPGPAPRTDPPLARLSGAATGYAASLDAFDLVRAALVAWGVIAAACLAVWSQRWRRLARQVADRRTLDGAPARMLEDLCTRAGRVRPVRLSATPALAAPITFGLTRAEVCLPERALIELAPDELRAMLAHELAHVVRRDPLWLALTGFLERVLFFQPLARFARRRWQEEAELACDDLAVRWTDERLSLATCLTEVAGWLLHEPRALAGLPVPSMALAAHGRAGLGRRVRRLIDEPPSLGARGSRWIAPLCVAGLASIVAAAPRIAPTAREADRPERSMRQLALDVLEHAAERADRLPSEPVFGSTPALEAPVIQTPALDASALDASTLDALDDVADAPEAEAIAALAPEALQVIGPHVTSVVAAPPADPGLDDLLRGLERSIALLEGELHAIADEASALDGWSERIERIERRIQRLGEQHERLAATAAMLVALDAQGSLPATTTGIPSGTPSMTLNEVKR